MELSSLVEYENRNHMFGMEILPGAVSFSILRHMQTPIEMVRAVADN